MALSPSREYLSFPSFPGALIGKSIGSFEAATLPMPLWGSMALSQLESSPEGSRLSAPASD